MKHYGVKFKSINSSKKDSEYKKIPVLLIGDKQINDSEIIATVLSGILGSPYDEREKMIEKIITTGIMISFEINVVESTSELQKCSCFIGGCLGCLIFSVACLIPLCNMSASMHRRFPDAKQPAEYGKDFADFLTTKPYFHGDTLGVIDCSIYGVLFPFKMSKSKAYLDFIGADERLGQWAARMEALSDVVVTT